MSTRIAFHRVTRIDVAESKTIERDNGYDQTFDNLSVRVTFDDGTTQEIDFYAHGRLGVHGQTIEAKPYEVPV